MDITNLSATDPATIATMTPILIAIVEIYKKSGLPVKFAGIASMVTGIALAFLLLKIGSYQDVALSGLMAGIAASGVWSQAKQLAPSSSTQNENTI